MASRWYCKVGNQQFGPLSAAQLKRMAQRGQLRPESPVRCGDDGRWVKAAQVKGLLSGAGSESGDDSSAGGSTKRVRSSQAKPRTTAAKGAGSSAGRSKKRRRPAAPTPPPAPPVVPQEIPVGRVVGATQQSDEFPAFSIDVEDSPIDETVDSPAARPRRSAKQTTVWLAIGAVGLAVVGGVAVLARPLLWKKTTGEAATAEATAQDAASGPPAPVEVDPESVVAESTPAAKASAAPPKPTETQRLIRSVRAWRDPRKSILFGTTRLSVVSIWRSSDPGGSRTSALGADRNLGAAGAETKDHQPASDTNQDVREGKYLFVELRLENTSNDKPLAYGGWNGAVEEKFGAVLVDDADQSYARVSLKEAPARGRKASENLEPGESINDVLVFLAPSTEVEKLKLALPYSAIHPQPGGFGYEIAGYMVSDGLDAEGGDENPIAARAENAAQTAVSAAGGEEKDRPPTIEELNRQFEKADKAYQKMNTAEGEPATPADAPAPEGDKKPAPEGETAPVESS